MHESLGPPSLLVSTPRQFCAYVVGGEEMTGMVRQLQWKVVTLETSFGAATCSPSASKSETTLLISLHEHRTDQR